MAAAILWLNADVMQWSQWQSIERIVNLAAIIFAAAGAYFLVLWLQGLRPAQLKKHS